LLTVAVLVLPDGNPAILEGSSSFVATSLPAISDRKTMLIDSRVLSRQYVLALGVNDSTVNGFNRTGL